MSPALTNLGQDSTSPQSGYFISAQYKLQLTVVTMLGGLLVSPPGQPQYLHLLLGDQLPAWLSQRSWQCTYTRSAGHLHSITCPVTMWSGGTPGLLGSWAPAPHLFCKPNHSLLQLPSYPQTQIYLSLKVGKPVLLKVRLFKHQLQCLSCFFVKETVSACTALPLLRHLRTKTVTFGCCLGSAAKAEIPGVSGLKEESPFPPPPSLYG